MILLKKYLSVVSQLERQKLGDSQKPGDEWRRGGRERQTEKEQIDIRKSKIQSKELRKLEENCRSPVF